MDRLDILNLLSKKYNLNSYLEIGVDQGYTFGSIVCNKKIGVDPDTNSMATMFITSDNFFAKNLEKFDLIFVDGLHHAEQVEKDINNALEVLNENGFIVCHDMNPPSELVQRVPRQNAEWTGDCWKAWVKIRSSNPNLYMRVVNTDYGCGIISRGNQELLDLDCELTYDNFDKNREKWLNLINVEDFIKEIEEK